MPLFADLTIDPTTAATGLLGLISTGVTLFFLVRGKQSEARKADAEADQRTTEWSDARAKTVATEWESYARKRQEIHERDIAVKDAQVASLQARMDAAEARERDCLQESAAQREEIRWLKEDNRRMRFEMAGLKASLRDAGVNVGTDFEVPALAAPADDRSGAAAGGGYPGPERRTADRGRTARGGQPPPQPQQPPQPPQPPPPGGGNQ